MILQGMTPLNDPADRHSVGQHEGSIGIKSRAESDNLDIMDLSDLIPCKQTRVDFDLTCNPRLLGCIRESWGYPSKQRNWPTYSQKP
jgi:hypothetical protein